MADLSAPIGQALECPIEVYEADTEDFVVHLDNPASAGGGDAAVENWTATLVIADKKGDPGTGLGVNTYTGTALAVDALGDIPIDMALFDLPAGTYAYQVRTVDTVTGDSPAKTRFHGKFKVLARSV